MQTILVIDDDPRFLDAMQSMLGSAGYHVLHAPDGIQASKLLDWQHKEIDLAIVDLALPGINGFEIIGAISRRPSKIKVIATTAVYKNTQLEVAAALGAHAVIRKPAAGLPLPESEWLGTVRQLLGTAGKSSPDAGGHEQMGQTHGQANNH